MRHLERLSRWALCTALVLPTAALADGASVADLGWMTGTWRGAIGGGNELEENWAQPRAGSMPSLVRMTGPGGTSMVELIVIEEEDDTLVLRLQQWDPGFQPRTPGPQVMKLAELGERSVTFLPVGAAEGLRRLTYSRPRDDVFVVAVETPNGQTIEMPLNAVR